MVETKTVYRVIVILERETYRIHTTKKGRRRYTVDVVDENSAMVPARPTRELAEMDYNRIIDSPDFYQPR